MSCGDYHQKCNMDNCGDSDNFWNPWVFCDFLECENVLDI